MNLINSLFPISIIFLMMEIGLLIHSYDIHLIVLISSKFLCVAE